MYYAGNLCFGNEPVKDVVVPDSVTSIGDYAFSGCTGLTSITIPDSVTSIGKYAFSGCTGLTSITIPDRVTSIDEGAFYNCRSLTSITIPDGVTSIGGSAFRYCTGLTSVKIGSGVTSIGDEAFYYCTSLSNVTIPSSVASIGYDAFDSDVVVYCNKDSRAALWSEENGNPYVLNDGSDEVSLFSGKIGKINWKLDKRSGLLELSGNGDIVDFNVAPPWADFTPYITEIRVNEGITSVGQSAFYGLNRVKKTVISEGVKSLGVQAFCRCTSLEEIILPESLEEIAENAFASCSKLEHIIIPKGTKTIGFSAFSNCKNLKNINIPNSVTEISRHAFAGCESLSSITIPYNVKIIDHMAFKGCTNLKEVVIYSKNCEFVSSCGLSYNHTIYGHRGSTAEAFAEQVGAEFIDIETIHKKHTEVILKAEVATCSKEGKTAGKMCSVCGKITVAQKTVAKKSHTYKTATTKATLTKNGKTVSKCTVCSYSKSTTVYYPKSIRLSTAEYTYNGKVKTPSVVVKDSKGNTLKKDTDYTVKYASGRKTPGKYTVTVTFKGKYSGTKKLTLTIKPKAPSISSIYSKTKGKAVIKWNNVTGESGYQVYYATSKNGTYKKVDSYSADKTAGSKTKLTSKKTYYFKVRAYKKTSSGTVYSSWSAVKSVKIK